MEVIDLLKSLLAAHCEHGHTHKSLAVSVGITDSTWYKWMRGLRPIPIPRRKTVERAFDCRIDWDLYKSELAALKSPPVAAPTAPVATDWGASPAKPAQTPPTAPKPAPRDEFDDLYGDIDA